MDRPYAADYLAAQLALVGRWAFAFVLVAADMAADSTNLMEESKC